jgi:hypothetical protein
MRNSMVWILLSVFLSSCGPDYIAEKREGLKPEKDKQAQEEKKLWSR